ncbi:hypothetical protein EUX98_g9349 [Antrodiella citrinella]|uniref:Uncharacterized protein n=1 Tax=Antrodiella citrinella TaxID=2447956 RepID=A0A4S4M0C7_9APHY|nr:hypothetical protein EUX98_g9349 [Antrodiella citrinella]
MPYICPLNKDTSAYLDAFWGQTLTPMSDISFENNPRLVNAHDIVFVEKGTGTFAHDLQVSETADGVTVYVCAHLFAEPRVVHNYLADYLPFTFDVVGEMLPARCCILPAAGGGFRNPEGTVTGRIASFWVQERPNRVAHTKWLRILDNMREFVACANRVPGSRCDTSRLYAVDAATGTAKLRFEWEPMAELDETELNLPIFNRFDRGIKPLEDTVPLGVALDVNFALNLVMKPDADVNNGIVCEVYARLLAVSQE